MKHPTLYPTSLSERLAQANLGKRFNPFHGKPHSKLVATVQAPSAPVRYSATQRVDVAGSGS